ncbi:MAG TPA: redoxin domain-containing protein [Lacipirellulaceae bacterium]
MSVVNTPFFFTGGRGRRFPGQMMLLAALLLIAAASYAGELQSSTRIEKFTLQDYLGAQHSLSEWQDKKAIVVVFIGTECPLAKRYGPRLAELAAEYEPRGVQFVAVNSNQQDTLREMAHYARVHKIDFPMLKDSACEVADQFGAERTPAAYVLDHERNVCYQGRIDDQYGVGYSRSSAYKNYVVMALDELLAGKPVSNPVTEAVGCYISRADRKSPTGDITYTNQIARIMQDHCVRCHRPGQIAPFSLMSYDDVAAWAETMHEVIDEGRMPPWHASPAYGHFSNDASMPDSAKQLFRQWIDNGMPEGDPADLPEPLEFTEGWQIPKPDVVFKMPEPFVVAAKGVVDYQYFEFDPEFKDDMWIRGAEVRPGNRSVVHHVLVFYVPPGQDDKRGEDALFNEVAAFAPGMPAGLWPEGYARLVPAGSKLVFQVHYTPNGSEQTDQTEVGLVFADPKAVNKEVKFGVAANTDFRIPPHHANFHVPAGYTFTQDTLVHALIPHMHYRGKSFRFRAEYPDGNKEILLDVPQYDFNWQNAYVLAEAKLIPKGTVLMCDGYYDNSADNLMNPDPAKEVRWGDQSWEEMMLGSFVYSLPETALRGEFPKVVHLHEDWFDVIFRYRPPAEQTNVEAVYLAGSFNDWKETGHRMRGPDAEGWYRTTVRLQPGMHEYKFVINGTQWTHDPDNPDQNGPYSNSVVRVRAVK